MTSISIAICTHNPDPRLLSILLASVQGLNILEVVEKIVIIDNNSDVELNASTEILEFLEQLPQAVSLRESKPGLSAARCGAIQETASDVVVFGMMIMSLRLIT